MRRVVLLIMVALWSVPFFVAAVAAEDEQSDVRSLAIDWKDNWLTISDPHIPGKTVTVYYLEAFCRPGSTNADWWSETLIPHKTERLADSDGGKTINLLSRLEDGVRVTHRISSTADEVSFHLLAENPTTVESRAHWAQSCIRVDHFTQRGQKDYIPQCFVFLEGKLTRLPTQPWATEGRLTPGQSYCPKNVPRTDVNPRPLSSLVTSNGLIGCYSADNQWILATAWEPYQELFQGVAVCIHSDFRIGGLSPGAKMEIRGKIYITNAGVEKLVARYERDFPEHLSDHSGKSEK